MAKLLINAIVYTIYYDPGDYPGMFVVRPFHVGAHGKLAVGEPFVADTIEGVRSVLPKTVMNAGREDDDPDHIIETWI